MSPQIPINVTCCAGHTFRWQIEYLISNRAITAAKQDRHEAESCLEHKKTEAVSAVQCWYNGVVLNLLWDTDKNSGQEREKAECNIKVALIVEAEMNTGKIPKTRATLSPLLLASLQSDGSWLNTAQGMWSVKEQRGCSGGLSQPGTKHRPSSQHQASEGPAGNIILTSAL